MSSAGPATPPFPRARHFDYGAPRHEIHRKEIIAANRGVSRPCRSGIRRDQILGQPGVQGIRRRFVRPGRPRPQLRRHPQRRSRPAARPRRHDVEEPRLRRRDIRHGARGKRRLVRLGGGPQWFRLRRRRLFQERIKADASRILRNPDSRQCQGERSVRHRLHLHPSLRRHVGQQRHGLERLFDRRAA